jgi:hypothetical protein
MAVGSAACASKGDPLAPKDAASPKSVATTSNRRLKRTRSTPTRVAFHDEKSRPSYFLNIRFNDDPKSQFFSKSWMPKIVEEGFKLNQKTHAGAVKKKYWKRILIIIGVLLVVILSYFTFVTIKARLDTPNIVKKALSSNQVTLRVSNLSQWQINALLKVEDPNFYHHRGIDLKTPGAGLTTITQAVVKKLYFTQFTPGIAKIKQSLIARFAFDPLVSKEQQLQLFINYMYFGSVFGKSVIGIDAAAHVYYHRSISELTEDEYLSLIAMIAAPESFHLLNRRSANAERCARIKKVISGAYQPKSLMDMYYGKLDAKTQQGLAPASYVPSLYEK